MVKESRLDALTKEYISCGQHYQQLRVLYPLAYRPCSEEGHGR